MRTLLRLALRDLAHQRAFSAFFAINLALGVGGALLLDSLQGSVGRTLESRSRTMLGADVRVSSTRPLSDDERARLDAAAGAAASSDLVQMYSMVAGPSVARLAELRGIDGRFPLYGALVLAGGPVGDEARSRLEGGEAWADAALLGQLGLSIGDAVRVGTQTFRIADTVVRDTGLSVRAASLAPRLYVARSRLGATGLVQPGSRVESQHLVRLPAGADADEAARRLRAALPDARVRVTSHAEAVAEMTGAYTRVTRYLGLVSLVALALAAIAAAYLFHAFLRRRVADLAILVSLGARPRRAQALLVLEVSVLAAAGGLLAIAGVALALPAAAGLLADLLPAELALSVGAREAATALAIALLAGPVSCLPMLARIGRLRVAELFQERAHLDLRRGPREALWSLPAAALLVVLAVLRVGDPAQGAWFAAALVASAALVAGAGRLLLPLAVRAGDGARVWLRLAMRQLSPARRGSRTAFTALALTAVLLTLPPQLRAQLLRQLDPPGEGAIPSLFLFDIQPEQAEPLAQHLRQQGAGIQRMAPMVRARLVAVNDREVGAAAPGPDRLQDAERLATRNYNLTWQAELHSTEKLVAGRPFTGAWNPSGDELPEISMETEFARRMGLGLGDRLRFDVQGVEVDGRVVNLREVRWTSLQPNFFVSFQPGVLDAAPAVYLASVPSLEPAARDALQASIVERYPNVSMIDVSRAVERALALLTQLRWAVAATGWTALAVGFVLIFAIARDEAEERRWDLNLMKVLGARHGLLRASLSAEFAVLGGLAALTGCAISTAGSAALAWAWLDVRWSPAWTPLLVVALTLPLVAAATARVATRRVLREKAALLLG